MPVEITHRGNDDQTLAQVVADAEIDVTLLPDCTHLNIERAAAVAGVVLVQDSDLNMIEQLAAGAGPAPYVFKLDDDGTVAAIIDKHHLPTTAPEHMAFSYTAGELVGDSAAVSINALNDAGSFVPVPGKVTVIGEYEVTVAPGLSIKQGHGIGVLFTLAGEILGYINAGYEKNDVIPEPLYSYADLSGAAGEETDALKTTITGDTLVGLRIGLYLDAAGKIGLSTSQAGDQGLVDDETGIGPGMRFTPGLYVSDGMAYPDIETIAGRLHIHAADLTLTYPAGAVDVYGNEIGG